jgi:chitodextrinase
MSHQWAVAPSNCPPQYTRVVRSESYEQYTCDYTGAISVTIESSLWARTWWTTGGDTVTEYTPTAKARLGTWDTRFDDDYAVWLATLPPPPPLPSCLSC